MRKILLIVLFFAAVNNLHSQDTVNAKFFPMHVGNYYVYKVTFFMVPGFTYQTARIDRDTVIDGKKYFHTIGFPILNSTHPSAWIRYDSLRSNIIIRSDTGCTYMNDIIFDSLLSSVGDIVECDNDGITTCLTSNDTLYSSKHDGLVYQNISYGKNIGIIGGCAGEPPPCEVYYSFKGAVINGVLWGDTTLTYLEQISSSIPEKINLHQNYPNPFNPSTLIKFDIPRNSHTNITIYDNTGRLVETILNQSLSPGTYEVQWNAGSYPSGVYFYRLETDKFSQTKKMLLIK